MRHLIKLFSVLFALSFGQSAWASCTVNSVNYKTIGGSGTAITSAIIKNRAYAWNNATDLITTCDVSSITDMSYVFRNKTAFNQNLSAWDTSSVTNMVSMFDGATSIASVSLQETGKVTNMSHMFRGATSLASVSLPKTGAVTDMSYMFDAASSFNQDIRDWDVDDVINFSGMFRSATAMISNFSSTPNWNTTPTKPWFNHETIVPTISSVSLNSANNALTVTFSESVYDTTVTSGDLEVSDFALAISGGSATVAATPTSITKTSQTVWVLGFSIVGTANGSEVLSVVPASSTSIYDGASNAVSTIQSGNTASLNDKASAILGSVSIASNNATTTNALTGDVVTLTFTASETITTPVVTFKSGGIAIADTNVTYTNTSGTTWTAAYTVSVDDTAGAVSYSIAYTDSAGNAGTVVTTGTGSVTVSPATAAFAAELPEINTEIAKVVDTSLTNLGITVKKISSTSRGRFIAKKPQAIVGGSTTTQAFAAALPEISEVFDSFDNMLVASAQKTRSITSFLQNSADECKALDQQAYAIDCLGSSLEELANELPASGDYAKVKFAFAKGAEQLKQLTINNAADSLPNKQFDNVARPLTATKSSDEDVAYLNEEITKIYDEITTTLLRSDDSSESRKLAYSQISAVFMSNKVLLRSSSDQSSNDPGYSGNFYASRGVINSKVSFTKSSKSHTSEYTTYTSSDVFFNRNKDNSISIGAGTQVQFEKMLNDKMMFGYFVGGSIGQNNKSGTLRSKSQTLGVSVGSYFVREIEGNMLLDGYATIMVTQNDLRFTTDIMTAKGLYYSQAGAVGLNLTGFIPLGSMELRPRTSLSLVRSLGKTINFDVTVGSASSTEQATHGSVSQVNLGLSPELRMPLPVWGFNRDQSNFLNENSVGTITPNITCQQLIKTTTTRHCGQGIALGFDTMSADGLTNITAGTSFDHMNGQTSAGIQLKIRTKW